MDLIELFSGVGAAGLAVDGRARVVAAFDQDTAANAAYAYNTGRTPSAKNLASVRASALAPFRDAAWWLSPPCQPYTRRGLGLDADDPRSAALARLVTILAELRPPVVMLENVPAFRASSMRARLLVALEGYAACDIEACPTALGVPMRRRRYYLVASRVGVPAVPSRLGCAPVGAAPARPLADYLDAEPAVPYLDERRVLGAGHSVHVVHADDPAAVVTCFTSAYGRSPVHAGSYLRDRRGVRRFSPAEISRLMGFPPGWNFPPSTPVHRQYELVGQSLSVDVARVVAGVGLDAARAAAS